MHKIDRTMFAVPIKKPSTQNFFILAEGCIFGLSNLVAAPYPPEQKDIVQQG